MVLKHVANWHVVQVVDGLAKALRGQMVAGTAASMLRDF